MGTTRLIYSAIGVLIIAPIFAFNIKKFVVKKEGEEPKPNYPAMVKVFLIALVLGMFIFSHYKFTLSYQPHLVLERYVGRYVQDLDFKGENPRFQLGEIIYPRYYITESIFPFETEAKEADRSPIYIPFMVETGGERAYYTAMLELKGNAWEVWDMASAPEELVEYARKFNFMKSEHANKWFYAK